MSPKLGQAPLGISTNILHEWVKAIRPDTGLLKDEALIEEKREENGGQGRNGAQLVHANLTHDLL